MSAERSFALAHSFPDEYIERWAVEFLQAETNRKLRSRGISFECFLTAPEQILAALAMPAELRVGPGLLAAQRAIQARLDDVKAFEDINERAVSGLGQGARCANGAWVQPLHHRMHPRKTWRKFHNREA